MPALLHKASKKCCIKVEALKTAQPDAAILSADWLVNSMEKGVLEQESKYDLVPTTDHVTSENPLPTIRPARPSQVTSQSVQFVWSY